MKDYPGPIFRADVKNPERRYLVLRDEPGLAEDRALVERLWSSYWPYSDSEFYQDIPRDFAARFWEMDVACELLASKFTLTQRSRHGPDICVSLDGHHLWIEAVAPKDGDGANASPDLVYDLQCRAFDGDDGIILRLRNAIEEKFKKYQAYRQDRIIKPDEPYVIALNGARVSASLVEGEPPWIVQSVYPFGVPRFLIDPANESFTVQHEYRAAVLTASKKEVATDIFLRPEYEGISGVLFSRSDAQNRRRDHIFVHNLKAVNKLNRGWLPIGSEYWPTAEQIHVTRHSEGGGRPSTKRRRR